MAIVGTDLKGLMLRNCAKFDGTVSIYALMARSKQSSVITDILPGMAQEIEVCPVPSASATSECSIHGRASATAAAAAPPLASAAKVTPIEPHKRT